MTWPETEVLVHISAPSKASDDVKYHCLAQAYVDFDAARRLDDIAVPQLKSGNDGYQQPDGGLAAAQSFDLTLSFQSVWENVSSPAPVQTASPGDQFRPATPNWGPRLKQHQTSYVSPNVVIPDSQPDVMRKTSASRLNLNNSFGSLHDTFISDSHDGSIRGNDTSLAEEDSPDLSMLRTAPRKRKASPSSSFTHQLTFAKRIANTRRGAPTHHVNEAQGETQSSDWEDIPSSAIVDFNSALELTSSLTENIPSSLPDECGQMIQKTAAPRTRATIPGLSRGTSDPLRTKRHRSPDEMGSSPPLVSRKASDARSWPKRPRLERVPATSSPIVYGKAHRSDVGETATSAAKNTSARKSMRSVLLIPSSQPIIESYHTSLRILSPEPPASCAHLDVAMLITDGLAKLAHDLDLARRFRPSEPAVRVLRPFERGYWKVNTSSWPAKGRHETWKFLAKYVGRGDAGWGVWCSRDEEPHTWLRLHCFAAVAGHTYLLLYAASKHIQDMEVAWMDASGAPTIMVSPKKRRRMASGM